MPSPVQTIPVALRAPPAPTAGRLQLRGGSGVQSRLADSLCRLSQALVADAAVIALSTTRA